VKLLRSLFLASLLAVCAPALAQVKVNALPNGTIPGSADFAICDQAGSTNKCTYGQISQAVSQLLGLTAWATANFPTFVVGDCLSNNGTSLLWTTCGSGGGSGTVTNVSVTTANGLGGTVTNPTTTPSIILFPTFGTGIAYSNGSTFVAAVAANFPTLNQPTTGQSGTTLSFATSPSQCTGGLVPTGILANGNATGCFSPSGTGTVTSFSIVTANGFTGSVATATSTPALTLAPNFSGIAYSTGSALTGAVAANFPILNQPTTGNAGTATALAATPTGCAGGQFANTIAANGNLGCATPSTGNALTSTYIGYGNGSNVLTGTSNFTFTNSSSTITLGLTQGGNITANVPTTATQNGYGLILTAGSGGSTSGAGGEINVTAGSGGGTSSGAGGVAQLSGGAGSTSTTTGAAAGGSSQVLAGNGSSSTTGAAGGGIAVVQGGSGGGASTSAPGGGVQINGGSAGGSSNSPGGSVLLNSGGGAGTGIAGPVTIEVNSLQTGLFEKISGGYEVVLGDNTLTSSLTDLVGGTAANTQANGSPILTLGSGGNVTNPFTITSNGVCLANGTNCPSTAPSVTPGTTTVIGVTAPCLLDNSAGTTMGCPALGSTLAINSNTIGTSVPARTVTTSPTVLSTDMGGQIQSNVSGGGTLTIPAISSTVFAAGQTLSVVNYSTSTEAVSTTPTVNSGGGCVTASGIPASATWQLLSNGTTLDCFQTVPAGSVSSLASGSQALGTSAIASGTCATTIQVAITGATTSDTANVTYMTDPNTVTGYKASASGKLDTTGFMTAGELNIEVCNGTASSITPSAMSVHYSVTSP
jgi:hypothetical protein